MNELAHIQNPLRELALFAGAGGGILGGHLLGWRCVCAVEWEPYPAGVLIARQNEGFLPPFPIWDDVRTFDGKPWRGVVDVVSGGFPCQDISAAGKGRALRVSDPACGKKWHGSLAKYDRDTCSWRTAQYSLHGDLELFSGTWPRWGTMRNGGCSERTQPEVSTNANVSGLLPTVPATLMVITGAMATAEAKINNEGRRKSGVKTGSTFWWDVTVHHLLAGGPNTRNLRPDPVMGESLMGWPLQWTDIKPSGTDKFQRWCALHGIPSTKD
jgi:hypothetical protein